MNNTHKTYYLKNKNYTNFLEKQNIKEFKKYINYVKLYIGKGGKFLDVGCGSGIVLDALEKKRIDAYGIEVSDTSVALCKKKKLKAKTYDGNTIPFKDNFFDVVGSYNVLEHVDKPIKFLDESLRTVKVGGYIIISCPNFLSLTSSYHPHTKGLKRKLSNFATLLSLMGNNCIIFAKMKPIVKEPFEPDDDAVNVTNPVSIMKWGKKKNLSLIYWSGRGVYFEGLSNKLDTSFLKLFLGSTFIVFKKNEK